MNIGEKIKQRRKELKWSQRELAERMGYNNHSTITRIESGKVDIPQSRIVQFAEVLQTDVAYLMNWEEVEKKNDIATDITLKLFEDQELLEMVEMLANLGFEQRQAVKPLLIALSTADK